MRGPCGLSCIDDNAKRHQSPAAVGLPTPEAAPAIVMLGDFPRHRRAHPGRVGLKLFMSTITYVTWSSYEMFLTGEISDWRSHFRALGQC